MGEGGGVGILKTFVSSSVPFHSRMRILLGAAIIVLCREVVQDV